MNVVELKKEMLEGTKIAEGITKLRLAALELFESPDLGVTVQPITSGFQADRGSSWHWSEFTIKGSEHGAVLHIGSRQYDDGTNFSYSASGPRGLELQEKERQSENPKDIARAIGRFRTFVAGKPHVS